MKHGDLVEGPLGAMRLRVVESSFGVALINAPAGLLLLAPTVDAWERLGFVVVASGGPIAARAALQAYASWHERRTG